MWSCSQSLGMQHSCIVCRTAKIVFKVRPGNKDVDLTQSLSIWVGVSDPTKYKYVHIMLKRRVWVLVSKINTRVMQYWPHPRLSPPGTKLYILVWCMVLQDYKMDGFIAQYKWSRSLDAMLLQTAQWVQTRYFHFQYTLWLFDHITPNHSVFIQVRPQD